MCGCAISLIYKWIICNRKPSSKHQLDWIKHKSTRTFLVRSSSSLAEERLIRSLEKNLNKLISRCALPIIITISISYTISFHYFLCFFQSCSEMSHTQPTCEAWPLHLYVLQQLILTWIRK